MQSVTEETVMDNRGYGPLYDTKKRLASYWQQIEETREVDPSKILEIGVGSRFVSRYLSEYYNVFTMDVTAKLKPQCVGSVLSLPFMDRSFDVVLCCQVLEHLPFSDFPAAISELYRVSGKRLVLSLPDKRYFRAIQLPKLGRYRLYSPFFRPLKHEFDGEHHWEVNAKGSELKKVLDVVEAVGFKVVRTYQIFENFHHRFFILESA